MSYMHRCPKCGQEFSTQSAISPVKCPYCGTEFSVAYQQQMNQPYNRAYDPQFGHGVFDNGPSGKARGVAALLAILLGGIGAQYFYLGKNKAAIICLLVTIFSCGVLGALVHVLSVVQGVIMLTQTEEEFELKYANTPETFPIF